MTGPSQGPRGHGTQAEDPQAQLRACCGVGWAWGRVISSFRAGDPCVTQTDLWEGHLLMAGGGRPVNK